MLENKLNEDKINENEELAAAQNYAPESEPAPEGVEVLDTPDGVGNADTPEETVSEQDPNETFGRKYVEKLRKESAGYREKAKRSEELEKQLHAALVRLDGRLADPEDLDFNEAHLEDPEALAATVTELVNRKPGLKAQQLRGDVGAGKRGSDPKPSMDLLQIMRGM